LYERLGGIYAIAAVVNDFSDNILKNIQIGTNSKNPQLRKWSREQAKTRLPGLKWLRTLWVASIAGGPYKYWGTKPGNCPFGVEKAHARFHITSEEFDAVAAELVKSLRKYKVPQKEQQEVLAAFGAHKPEVVDRATKCAARPKQIHA
jgi:hemoglobin